METLIHFVKYIKYYTNDIYIMDNLNQVVTKLTELDERLHDLRKEKKAIDDEIKVLEEALLVYCQDNQQSIETVTGGQYNMKRTTGRRFKKKD